MSTRQFNIDQLKNMDTGFDEKALGKYQDKLVKLFCKSAEGETLAKTCSDVGYWAGLMIDMGYSYLGISPPEMGDLDVEEILMQLFPRKVTIPPEDAKEVVPELLAFWSYLKREYRLENADSILSCLRKNESEFPGIMNDPSRFGMAKSIMTTGMESGFDMTSEEGIAAFMLHYNEHIANTPMEPEGVQNMLPPMARKKFDVPPPVGSRNQRKRMRRRNRK